MISQCQFRHVAVIWVDDHMYWRLIVSTTSEKTIINATPQECIETLGGFKVDDLVKNHTNSEHVQTQVLSDISLTIIQFRKSKKTFYRKSLIYDRRYKKAIRRRTNNPRNRRIYK